jgi:hypothetical protein
MSEETAVEQAKGTALASAEEMGLDSGLEDFDSTDMVMPRLSIEHGNATFKDNLTGEEHPKLQVVMLGLIKQRILWGAEVEEGDRPLCKSYNFKEGHPDDERFPWEASGFDKANAGDTLPCGSCALKEWDSHPKNSTPWCSEQHTFPVLMQTGEDEFTAPAILTVQRSAIKASKTYLTAFARSKNPLYTVVTEISLNPQKRGSVNYAVPAFKKVGATDQSEWSEFAEHYRTIREFITTPPPDTEDDGGSQSAGTTQAQPSEAAQAASDDDDLPF